MFHSVLLFQRHTQQAAHTSIVVIAGNIFSGVQHWLKQVSVKRVDDVVRREQDLYEIDVLFANTLKHEPDILEIHVLVVFHDMGGADGLVGKNEI